MPGRESRIDRLERSIASDQAATRATLEDVKRILTRVHEAQLQFDPAAAAAERAAHDGRLDEIERWRRWVEGRGMLIQAIVGLVAGLLGGIAAFIAALRSGG